MSHIEPDLADESFSSRQVLRKTFGAIVVAIAWALALLGVALSIVLRQTPLVLALIVAMTPVVALTLSWRASPQSLATQLISAIALVSSVALLVAILSGHPWQIDMHMAFFAILAILSGWCAWQPIALGAALIALHHLVLNFTLTSSVFPESEGDIGRVLLHATIVIVQTAVLLWVVHKLGQALDRGDSQARLAVEAGAERLAIEQRANAAQSNDRRDVVERLIGDFQTSVARMLADVEQNAVKTRETADALSGETSAAQELTAKVASAAQQISTNSTQVAVAVEELVAGIKEISRQTAAGTSKINAMADAASKTKMTIATLDQAAAKIVAVTTLIQNVADRTNLLSLNATIEAARAGEVGRGFAVVASEVKTLALETMKSTKEINELVLDIQRQVQGAVVSTGEVSRLAEDAMESSAAIAAAVDQQGTVTEEIARSINETSTGTEGLTKRFESVANVIASASQSVVQGKAVSSALGKSADALRGAVDEFLSKVKAA